MSQTPTPVRYRWQLLRAGRFRLDGGSMFGLIPRVIWSRSVPADDKGRIEVQHNCLLLERADDPPPASTLPAPRLILIEVGTGDKLDAKSRAIFDLEDRSILTALHEVDCRAQDIGAVVVSHLHFDHAGALTRLARPGETPDWTGPASCFAGSRGDHAVKLSFPDAKVFTQTREWSDALANRSVMTRTYFKDHLEPIKDRIIAVESPRPYPLGSIPDRDADPIGTVATRRTQIMPGLFVFLVPGHTWGQQAIQFTDTSGRTVTFTPDVMPTINHLGAAYSLGYDVEPYTSSLSRRWFLDEAAEHNWLLVLDHEPGEPRQRVSRADNWFTLAPQPD
ncbi:MAG: MBL fold metallo-hydrolase [Phycisphaerales bacterium]|nr:MBL fold metallo-hydrolase [Phycisphaerales bacterium]